MKNPLILLLVVATGTIGCTTDQKPVVTAPSPAVTATPDEEVAAEVQIYSAVIRGLVTRDHTFGGGKSPFKHIYVVDGVVPHAEDPMRNAFRGPSEPFSPDLIAALEDQLADLPPVTFVDDPKDPWLGKQGKVRNDGVIISLGAIEPIKDRVHVANSLWCGGLCGQWMTYVLAERAGRWKITGTTGPYAIS